MVDNRRVVVVVVLLSLSFVGVALVDSSVADSVWKTPLKGATSAFVNALSYVGSSLAVTRSGAPDNQYAFLSWTLLQAFVGAVLAYGGYRVLLAPMNRVRLIGDVGYIPENGMSAGETAKVVRRRRLVGNVPPVYPNGWFSVIESRDLAPGVAKSVSCLGKNLAVFRGEDGRAHVIDAYCPHMGANLGIGGLVKGSCLECPFHGWQFRGDDGKCVYIPYCESDHIPDIAKVTSYNVLERNGFVYIWHHAEGNEPDWEPPEIPEITTGDWVYRGRTEHLVNAHIEEVPENGADIAHLPQVHSPIMTSGTDLRYTYSKFWSFARHEWQGGWTQDSEQKHVGQLDLLHSIKIFGASFRLLDMKVVARQEHFTHRYGPDTELRGTSIRTCPPHEVTRTWLMKKWRMSLNDAMIYSDFTSLIDLFNFHEIGPGVVYLTFDSLFGKGAYLQSLTPVEPLTQRMIHHVYFKWSTPAIIAKFFLLAEAMMVERDIMIWNNKRYEGKPLFVKSVGDASVARHRRWYSQFYSENSPRLSSTSVSKSNLDW